MIAILSRNWWALALRGLIAILFGVVTLAWPRLTLAMLVFWFGAYVFLDGVFGVIYAVRTSKQKARWWVYLLEGLAGIAVGVLTFLLPGMTALVLLYFIAAWIIITGFLRIIAAVRLRQVIRGEWLLILSGILAVLYGLLLFAFPAAGSVAIVWLIAAYAIIFGILLLLLALRLRQSRKLLARA
ncbi:MAG: HdeD family acid-resistance protein [Anaerolineales bacterium]|nr:HdeD family acid-resistance protein [Anaerolineales bacterium]